MRFFGFAASGTRRHLSGLAFLDRSLSQVRSGSLYSAMTFFRDDTSSPGRHQEWIDIFLGELFHCPNGVLPRHVSSHVRFSAERTCRASLAFFSCSWLLGKAYFNVTSCGGEKKKKQMP